MTMCKCLFCYKELEEGQQDFHPQCARRFFGLRQAPALDYRHSDLDSLAEQIIRSQTSLTGVQPKLSLNLDRHQDSGRLTLVGLWGEYIFKPQSDAYPQLPENEDLTMHLAEAAHISVVPHSLIRLADGELGYLTRRIDRTPDGEKVDMEDLCQVTLHPTEYKYKGSYEQVAKAIVRYSGTPRLDVVNYMQLLLFCFITGNNDMHLKNFSLYRPQSDYQLTPAYDLLNVAIANPGDEEELALTLSARKSNLHLRDFLKAAQVMGIDPAVVLRLVASFRKVLPRWEQLIDASFLTPENQSRYKELLLARMARLEG